MRPLNYLFVFFTLITLAEFAKAECTPACLEIVKKIPPKDQELLLVKTILGKNEAYLKEHPDASSSLIAKVRSNILMSKLQIETLQNESQFIKDEIQKKGCQECLSLPTKES